MILDQAANMPAESEADSDGSVRWAAMRAELSARREAERMPDTTCRHRIDGTAPIRVRGICSSCDRLAAPDPVVRYRPGEHRMPHPAADAVT